MDRTKEFLLIVDHSRIPQDKFQIIPFYMEVRNMELEIESLLGEMEKITPYEAFKSQALLSKSSEMLKKYKSIELCENPTRDYNEVISNLKSMIKTKSIKYTLKLNVLFRRLSKKMGNSFEEKKDEILQTEMPNHVKTQITHKQDFKDETLEERKRILNSITEMGQIVEDIAMHVNLQEEQLKRIDDVLLKNDKWTKKAISELNDVWDIFKSNRSFMIKFFVFWIIIIFIFWVLRRI